MSASVNCCQPSLLEHSQIFSTTCPGLVDLIGNAERTKNLTNFVPQTFAELQQLHLEWYSLSTPFCFPTNCPSVYLGVGLPGE